MSLDSTILRVLKHRDKFDLYKYSIPQDLLDPSTRVILADLGRFFSETTVDTASTDSFWPWFMLAHPKLKDEARAKLQLIVRTMQADVPPELEDGLLSRMEDARQAGVLMSALEKYNAGEEISILQTVTALAESVPLSRDALPRVQFDIEKMLAEEQNDWGFHWPWDCVNSSMRGLRPGDFGIIAARVDQGKSTMVAQACAHFAPQVDAMFPGEDRSILWLNNEGPGDRLNQRLLASTMNASLIELVEGNKNLQGLWSEVIKRWGGREVVQVYDVHDKPLSSLEQIIRRTKPAVIVCDMLDNVPFDGVVNNGGSRTDQILEAAYQRARIWAVKYGAAVLATSQLSADAAGEPFPGMHMLANSRTGKPGAADFIMMLGHSDDPGLSLSRWISLPKNKLSRSRGKKDPRMEVLFDGPRARINEPKEA